MSADDADRARSRSPHRDHAGEDDAEHSQPWTEVHGWVCMCPLGQTCGKQQKRLGWYESKDAAVERVVEHLQDGNCDHGRDIDYDEALFLAQEESCYYEERRFFDEQGQPVHWPHRRGNKGGKGSKGQGKGKKGEKGGKGWAPAPEPAAPPRARPPAFAPPPAPGAAAPGPAPVQRMPGPNAHILAALTGSVPEAPLHLGTIVEAPFLCTQLFFYVLVF